MVEQWTENPCVPGSIPGGTTKQKPRRNAGLFLCSNMFVYIIYSKSINKYYVGETYSIEERLTQHNSKAFKDSFTTRAQDWIVVHSISCLNRSQARKIESHIKRMKSTTYIKNLIQHPEISEKLLLKYGVPGSSR